MRTNELMNILYKWLIDKWSVYKNEKHIYRKHCLNNAVLEWCCCLIPCQSSDPFSSDIPFYNHSVLVTTMCAIISNPHKCRLKTGINQPHRHVLKTTKMAVSCQIDTAVCFEPRAEVQAFFRHFPHLWKEYLLALWINTSDTVSLFTANSVTHS